MHFTKHASLAMFFHVAPPHKARALDFYLFGKLLRLLSIYNACLFFILIKAVIYLYSVILNLSLIMFQGYSLMQAVSLEACLHLLNHIQTVSLFLSLRNISPSIFTLRVPKSIVRAYAVIRSPISSHPQMRPE